MGQGVAIRDAVDIESVSARVGVLDQRVQDLRSGPRCTPVRRAALVEVADAAARVQAQSAWVSARAAYQLYADILVEQRETSREFAAYRDAHTAAINARPGQEAPTPAAVRKQRAQARADDRAMVRDDEQLAQRSTAACLSLELGISLTAADRLLRLGIEVTRHPVVGRALRAARIDERQAHVILRAVTAVTAVGDAAVQDQLIDSVLADPTDPCDPGARGRLVRELQGVRTVWRIPAHKLARILAREAARLEPASVEAEAKTVADNRGVSFYPGAPSQPPVLALYGPGHLTGPAFDLLDARARAAKAAGADGTVDQIRFDLAIGDLTQGALGLTLTTKADQTTETPQAQVNIDLLVAMDALTGHSDEPPVQRTARGDVPVGVDQVKQALAGPNAKVRLVMLDPATGTVTGMSKSRYSPSDSLRELVKLRDGHSTRFPTGGSRRLELDHIIEFNHANPDTGGPTTASNLASVGKRDHQDKTDRLIHLTGDANGELTYRTATGHTYPSLPHQYLNPKPPASPESPPESPPQSPPTSPPTSPADRRSEPDDEPPF